MSLSTEDYKYFDAKFEALYRHVDAKIGKVEKVQAVHADIIARHDERIKSQASKWGSIISIIVSVAMWLVFKWMDAGLP